MSLLKVIFRIFESAALEIVLLCGDLCCLVFRARGGVFRNREKHTHLNQYNEVDYPNRGAYGVCMRISLPLFQSRVIRQPYYMRTELKTPWT